MAAMLTRKPVKKVKKPMGNPHWGHAGAHSKGVSGNPAGGALPPHIKKPKPKRRPRNGNPAWVKGKSANPAGRPKGSLNKYRMVDLVRAIQEVEEEDKKDLLKHFVVRAFASDRTLSDLFKKILPDLKAVEVSVDPEKPFQLIINMDPTLPTQKPGDSNEEG